MDKKSLISAKKSVNEGFPKVYKRYLSGEEKTEGYKAPWGIGKKNS